MENTKFKVGDVVIGNHTDRNGICHTKQYTIIGIDEISKEYIVKTGRFDIRVVDKLFTLKTK